MKFCKRCVMPDTKPNLNFDGDGICDACRSQEAKIVILIGKVEKLSY